MFKKSHIWILYYLLDMSAQSISLALCYDRFVFSKQITLKFIGSYNFCWKNDNALGFFFPLWLLETCYSNAFYGVLNKLGWKVILYKWTCFRRDIIDILDVFTTLTMESSGLINISRRSANPTKDYFSSWSNWIACEGSFSSSCKTLDFSYVLDIVYKVCDVHSI